MKEKTGQDKMQFIGFGMGVTAFVVTMNELPEYADRVKGPNTYDPLLLLSPHLATDVLHYKIHATSVISSAFLGTPFSHPPRPSYVHAPLARQVWRGRGGGG